MAHNLSELFAGIGLQSVKGSMQAMVTSIVIDSRRATPGCLFFALPGLRSDGNLYIEEAVNRGATAVVTSRPQQLVPTRVAFLQVENPREVLALVSRRFFAAPDEKLQLVGVTGTNGKSTVTHILKHLLSSRGRTGMIGTIQYDLGRRTVPSFKTTPESVDLLSMLAQIRDAGCHAAVMEVSSHGLEQMRVNGLHFAAAAFTNLTRDHLDYHQSLDAYFDAKAKLFSGAIGTPPQVAAVNIDDPYGQQMLKCIAPSTRVLTYAIDVPADVQAAQVSLGFQGTKFVVTWPDGTAAVETPMLGRFNVSNLLCVLTLAHGLNYDVGEFLPLLASVPGVPGRMERVENDLGCNVLVDYAHTDDALSNVLATIRAITPGRVLVVFGCGGDRDRTKRPRMTAAVQQVADLAWATSDNPRKESQAQIFSDMRTGVLQTEQIEFVEDRRHAISLALDAAGPGDSLLIAGKGHEPYQEFGDTIVPFDDRLVARELIAVKRLRPLA